METPRNKPSQLRLVASSTHRSGSSSALRAPPLDAGLHKALQSIESALERRWTVTALARLAGMSRAVFARRFVAALGTSPLRYLTERRMERARQLLADSQLPLSAVAERVGYVSEFAFNRAFKRHLRVPPGTYRRRLLARDSQAPRMAA